jgi:hypothetical protein
MSAKIIAGLVMITIAAAPAAAQKCAPQAHADPWPYLDRPADPWLAVDGAKPRAVAPPKDRTGHRKGQPRAVCDAAHDHCFRDCTWLLAPTPTTRRATPYHFGVDGKFFTHVQNPNPSPGFVAYRTVPVTKKTLAKGMLVAAVVGNDGPRPDAGGIVQADGTAEIENGFWDLGIVESIEWDRNLVRFEGRDQPYYLSGTRLVVLRFEDGGKVEKIDGVEAKAPAVADLIGPAKAVGPTDPWTQVGKDKQPLASTDATPMSSLAVECAGKQDHCLRPWVWFVDVEGRPVTARWTGKGFVQAAEPEYPIKKPGLAYRTRPAKDTDLKPGTKILVYDQGTRPQSEKDAHFYNGWTFATVESIDRFEKKFQPKGGGSRRLIDSARVLVVYWLPGETAAAVE